ncbi:MAG: hypothetical protein JW712_12875 [Dehalococcoidales bacterium]|nr:hypothetical protein [Dehalococcoidales bacterium]
MEIPAVTNNEVMKLRSNLLSVLIGYVQTVPARERNLSLSEMALMTGKTKTFVKSALESLQQNGSLTIERNMILNNNTALMKKRDA